MATRAGQSESLVVTIPAPKVEVASFPITGETPLIVHRWSEKAKRAMLDKQQKKATLRKEAKNPEEDFQQSRYVSSEGWDGFPAGGFKASLVGAARQAGKDLPMTLAKRLVFIVADDATTGLVRIYGEPTMRDDMVRLETGVADIRFRAQYWPWSAILQVRYNASIISQEQVANLVMLSGMSEGIGEWRPSAPKSCSGDFGLWRIDQ